jgi:hypothetical protein
MSEPRRVLTPVKITSKYQAFRSGRLEAWSAESTDGVWKYERIEDVGTPWEATHVPTGKPVPLMFSSLPNARAATADGTARDQMVRECPHPADQRGQKTERGTFDYRYETCKACAGIRPDHDDDDGCRTCWDHQDGTGPGHEWTPE